MMYICIFCHQPLAPPLTSITRSALSRAVTCFSSTVFPLRRWTTRGAGSAVPSHDANCAANIKFLKRVLSAIWGKRVTG